MDETTAGSLEGGDEGQRGEEKRVNGNPYIRMQLNQVIPKVDSKKQMTPKGALWADKMGEGLLTQILPH